MKHKYIITGMTCSGCEAKVKSSLLNVDHITEVIVSKDENSGIITMDSHVPLAIMQEALGGKESKYQINEEGFVPVDKLTEGTPVSSPKSKPVPSSSGGKYYCPMHCEGDKTYDVPGDCPICGMDLVQAPVVAQIQQYTCPMHPEIVQDGPGSCPICGMNLVPMKPEENAENQTYQRLLKKMKVAVVFTLPVFIIAMMEMLPDSPLLKIMHMQGWNWVQFILTIPVVFYACNMFFMKAWRSIITWNLNMFTLIGIGTGVAFLFSLAGLFFSDIFPAEFRSHHGTVA
ncbi:MAG: heavy metal-binding domain-containing protein, partial [Saprospiraceae bacterium]